MSPTIRGSYGPITPCGLKTVTGNTFLLLRRRSSVKALSPPYVLFKNIRGFSSVVGLGGGVL